MRTAAIALIALTVLWAAPSRALAAQDDDLLHQTELAGRFAPFDTAAGSDWSPAFPFAFFRTAAKGETDSFPIPVGAGSYRMVVLCDCASVAYALKGPDGAEIGPERSNEQSAMYSFTAAAGGDFQLSAVMQGCEEDHCSFAAKVWMQKASEDKVPAP